MSYTIQILEQFEVTEEGNEISPLLVEDLLDIPADYFDKTPEFDEFIRDIVNKNTNTSQMWNGEGLALFQNLKEKILIAIRGNATSNLLQDMTINVIYKNKTYPKQFGIRYSLEINLDKNEVIFSGALKTAWKNILVNLSELSEKLLKIIEILAVSGKEVILWCGNQILRFLVWIGEKCSHLGVRVLGVLEKIINVVFSKECHFKNWSDLLKVLKELCEGLLGRLDRNTENSGAIIRDLITKLGEKVSEFGEKLKAMFEALIAFWNESYCYSL